MLAQGNLLGVAGSRRGPVPGAPRTDSDGDARAADTRPEPRAVPRGRCGR